MKHTAQNARTATADWLLANLIPLHMSPPPRRAAFVQWLKRNNVPRLKCNPAARRGGGVCWWSVAHVEKLLQNRTCRR